MVWCGNDDGWTEAVGSKLPNDYGLHDMHGNIWEWCEDWWHETYSGAPTNGSPWDTQVASYPYRVIRGGLWNDDARYCRSADRLRYNPTFTGYNLGFRVSRTP
jgi:formylglycine-generating enzyme required for sulfatase activity